MFATPRHDPSARLQALRGLQILDTPSEQAYDDVVALATHIFDVPMAAVTLLDERRQWFKARVGLLCSETDIESSFCYHAVKKDATLVVEDSHLDPRFAKNALVLGEPFIRFYAGAPVYVDDVAVGAVCVIDYRPRRPMREQIEQLEALARQVGVILSLRQTALRLARSEARFEAFMAHAPIAAYIKDDEGRYLYMSPFGVAAYGDGAEVQGTLDEAWIDPETLADLRRHEKEVRESGQARRREFRTTLADGDERDWSVVKFPFEDPSGGSLLGAVATDVTLQKDAERQLGRFLAASRRYAEQLEDTNMELEKVASTDGLTGVLNHKAFKEEFDVRLAAGRLSLIMLDVDRFKSVNDDYGHLEGDAVLRRVATILREYVQPDDLVGRLGGEEFAIVLQGATQISATAVAESLRHAVESADWSCRPITASFGVATWVPGDTRESLLDRADRAMYKAKGSGRDCVVTA